MRMGTFLLGGIVGALAVTFINRNNGMMMANLANAGQSVGSMVNKAKSKLSNMNMNGDKSNHNDKSDYRTDKSTQHAEFSRVKEIVNEDPNLKAKVNEILEDNKETATPTRMQ